MLCIFKWHIDMSITTFLLGNITTPLDSGHPEITKYPNNIECIWYIDVQHNFHVNVSFYGRFEIEADPDCNKDYLIV